MRIFTNTFDQTGPQGVGYDVARNATQVFFVT